MSGYADWNSYCTVLKIFPLPRQAAEGLHTTLGCNREGRLLYVQDLRGFLLTTVPMEEDGPTPTQRPPFHMPEMEMSEFLELNDNELINLMPDFSASAWEHPDAHHAQVHEALKLKDASKEITACWGGLLSGSDASCTPGFVSGKGHFKNHFCGCCRSLGLQVPLERIRALSSSQHEQFENVGGRGLWSESLLLDTGFSFRLVNQTQKCTGPRLIILQTPPASDALPWAQLPARWLTPGSSTIRLLVSKGTLTPAATVSASSSMMTATDALDSSCITGNDGGTSGMIDAGYPQKRSRSSTGSDGTGNASTGSLSSRASMTAHLTAVHEQLERLIVDTLISPVEEQDATGDSEGNRTKL